MKRYEVKISSGAWNDLAGIQDYILFGLQNPIAAEKIIKNIIKKCRSLVLFPKVAAGKIETSKGEMFLTRSGNFSILYMIDDDKMLVTVVSVIYSRRNFKRR